PWLADQFEANRPWSGIVADLLASTADMAREPEAAFFRANSDSFEPKPALLAASTGRLFLGVQVACAECHNHPFASWTQDDFWGLAAFFGRVHKRSKSDFRLTEDLAGGERGEAAEASIVIPDGAGKGAGRKVAARFLGEPTPAVDNDRPL